jgi:N-acetylmuramoyl-L-alanine amidase
MLFLLVACASVVDFPAPPPSSLPAPETLAAPPPVPAWPAAGALSTPTPSPVAMRLLLDAGHGASGNSGNTNCKGESEQDVMRRVTDAVAATLVADGIPLTRTRPDAAPVSYDTRLQLANQHDLLISLHSDTRAGPEQGWLDQAAGTWWTGGAAGFAVLWSDEGGTALVEQRLALARALARQLSAVGFLAYPGADYSGLYDPDPATPGVFVDRHQPAQRIRLLRRPKVPSVIIETHEAHDCEEVARWEEPATTTSFARALEAALLEYAAP